MNELRVTDTNSVNDSKGRAFGLEGNDFLYVIGGIVGALGCFLLMHVLLGVGAVTEGFVLHGKIREKQRLAQLEQEQVRQAEERARLAEAERRATAERRLRAAHAMSENWHRANELRAFRDACRARFTVVGGDAGAAPQEQAWMDWLDHMIANIDPLLSGAVCQAVQELAAESNNLVLLRSCFTKVGREIGLRDNPFADIIPRDEETVLRQPYSEEELAAILEAAKCDPFIYPIIVTAACTAMRRGDCCLLEKSAVDLKEDFLRVKTAKTGEWVEIPIFPMLRQVLLNAETNDASPYMFPRQAVQYIQNPDRITEMAGRVLRKAGFTDSGEIQSGGHAQSRGPLRSPRQVGVRRASLRDFHSFRVTWVTLALVAGVPIEVVKKVTGHRTVEVVMKHYFRPGREEMRQTLTTRMPAVLTGHG